MTETLEQITERATREAEVKITYEPPAPSFSNALTDNHLLALAKEAEKTGYIAGVIAEATRDRWIKVEERLPIKEKWVLVIADGAMNCAWYDKIRGWHNGFGDPPKNIRTEEITHWMPLPSPPNSPTT